MSSWGNIPLGKHVPCGNVSAEEEVVDKELMDVEEVLDRKNALALGKRIDAATEELVGVVVGPRQTAASKECCNAVRAASQRGSNCRGKRVAPLPA